MGTVKRALIQECICGATLGGHKARHQHGIPVQDCPRCGATVQRVPWSEEELGSWYRDEYQQKVYTHSLQHDSEVARERVKAYGPKLKGKILDVGCGNAAFVTACKDKGLDAVGQDIGGNPLASCAWYVHNQGLFDCNFPTDFYDVVTCHDVLEHVPDPYGFLQECQRILKPGGWFILDFPDFAFEHHWKEIEHLWMLDQDRVHLLLKQALLDTIYITRPVESKMVFYCTTAEEKRLSILLPPGIGDSYWSVVKLPGFMKQLGEKVVDLHVSDPDDKQRSLDFIKKIPWACGKGYVRHSTQSAAFQEAYMQNGRYLFQSVVGCDYFLAFNGVMRFGQDIDKIERGWGSEWFPPLFRSKEEEQAQGIFEDRYGPYVVAYFVEHGMYQRWLGQLDSGVIAAQLRRIKEQGFEVVFMGAHWDKGHMPSILAGAIGGVDLCGETTIDEMFALIRGSRGVIGWPAGNTIMATVLKKQTLLFWNDYFDRRFWELCCPPPSRNVWYHWAGTDELVAPEVNLWLDRIGKP